MTPTGPGTSGASAASSLTDVPRAPSSRTPTIADEYADLLRPLNNRQRRAMILRLTFGFYDDWRPTRAEMADLVAVELGTLSADEASRRQRQRTVKTARGDAGCPLSDASSSTSDK